MSSAHFLLLFAGDNVYVGLCSLCVPTFCATSAFLSMTGCWKGLSGPVFATFWVRGRQRCPAHPHTAKMSARVMQVQCNQIGEEIPVYDSLLCSSPHLVSSSNKSFHRSNASPVSHDCSSVVVFLAWFVLKYRSGIEE